MCVFSACAPSRLYFGDSLLYIEFLAAFLDSCLSVNGIFFLSRIGHVNYEDPFVSVGLPIFSIHGNHDDPTREGGVESLAALDLLHVANLVNYFGKSNKVGIWGPVVESTYEVGRGGTWRVLGDLEMAGKRDGVPSFPAGIVAVFLCFSDSRRVCCRKSLLGSIVGSYVKFFDGARGERAYRCIVLLLACCTRLRTRESPKHRSTCWQYEQVKVT